MPHTCNRQLYSINRPTSRTTADIVSGASKKAGVGGACGADGLASSGNGPARAGVSCCNNNNNNNNNRVEEK